MLNTISLAEAAKKALGDCSDYRLAKTLGISSSTVNAWRSRHTVMDDLTAIKAAKIAGIEPAEALVWLMAERHKNDIAGGIITEFAYRAIGS